MRKSNKQTKNTELEEDEEDEEEVETPLSDVLDSHKSKNIQSKKWTQNSWNYDH